METLNSIMVVCGWLITLGGAGAVIYKLLHPAFKLKNRVDKLTGNNIEGLKKTKEAMIKHLSEGI